MPEPDIHEELNQAAAGPLSILQALAEEFQASQKPCGTRFDAPGGPCPKGRQHRCIIVYPHMSHLCECGSHSHQTF